MTARGTQVVEAAFKAFRSQVFALYDQRAYPEALALIDQWAEDFREYEPFLFFWRACLAARMGDRAGAVGWLHQAAERGHWYGEQMLRDPDLDPIRESKELAELLCSG